MNRNLIIIFLVFFISACASHDKMYINSDGTFQQAEVNENLNVEVFKSSNELNRDCVKIRHLKGTASERSLSQFKVFANDAFSHIGLEVVPEKNERSCYLAEIRKVFYSFTREHGIIINISDYDSKTALMAIKNKSKVWTSYPKELYNPAFTEIQNWYRGKNT